MNFNIWSDIWIIFTPPFKRTCFLSLFLHLNSKVKSNDLMLSFPSISKVKEFYHTRMFRFIHHVLVLLALLSFVLLFKVLWSTSLASGTEVLCWNVVCLGLKRRRTGAEREEREERVTGWVGETGAKRESPREVNGWNVHPGSVNELHAELEGGAQVLCWGSRSQSGCDWHQKQHFMAENTVAECLGTYHTFSSNRQLVLVFCHEGFERKTFPQFSQ